jgi:hypothetical protein
MACISISVGIDSNGLDPEPPTGRDHAARDFAPIRDQ